MQKCLWQSLQLTLSNAVLIRYTVTVLHAILIWVSQSIDTVLDSAQKLASCCTHTALRMVHRVDNLLIYSAQKLPSDQCIYTRLLRVLLCLYSDLSNRHVAWGTLLLP